MKNQASNKIRYDFIDILKVFAIFIIVIGHFLPESNIIRIALYSFHVPIFFLISGYTFNNIATIKEFLIKIFKRIIIPYIFYFFISFFISFLFKESNFGDIFNLFYINGKVENFNSVLWFFPCFFFVSLNFKVLYKILNKKFWIIIPLNIIISILLFNNSTLYYFGLNKVILLTIYYAIGYLIKQFDLNKIVNSKFYNKYVILLIMFLSIIIYCNLNKTNNISINLNDINNIFIFLIFSILECIMLLLFTVNLKSNHIVTFLSKNTIFIMCTHLFFRVIIRKITLNPTIIFMLGICVFFIQIGILYIIRKLLHNNKIINNLEKIGIFLK